MTGSARWLIFRSRGKRLRTVRNIFEHLGTSIEHLLTPMKTMERNRTSFHHLYISNN